MLHSLVYTFDKNQCEIGIEDTDAREVILLCRFSNFEFVFAVGQVFDSAPVSLKPIKR